MARESPAQRIGRTFVSTASLAILALLTSLPADDAHQASAQDNFDQPERHFRVERPASLDKGDALVVYQRILDDMVAGYTLSQDPTARRFRGWRRYNLGPYRSATHGERFVNNYANGIAEDYDRLEEIEALPVGSILAKDSFAVTGQGDVFTGPLFLMEKMPAGFNPSSRDWRYSMILPDGTFFGVTNGDNSDRVEFCVPCHAAAGDEMDHLFYVPEGNRMQRFRLDEISN
ncbi:MAG: hypothetical protein AAF637_14350 [Pseudomonadota bacterium]